MDSWACITFAQKTMCLFHVVDITEFRLRFRAVVPSLEHFRKIINFCLFHVNAKPSLELQTLMNSSSYVYE